MYILDAFYSPVPLQTPRVTWLFYDGKKEEGAPVYRKISFEIPHKELITRRVIPLDPGLLWRDGTAIATLTTNDLPTYTLNFGIAR